MTSLSGGVPLSCWRGVGGGYQFPGSLPLLQACGGNAIRTWGFDALSDALLRECDSRGIAVVAGIWLVTADVSEAEAARLTAEAVAGVRQYKRYACIKAWCVGNEVELRTQSGPRRASSAISAPPAPAPAGAAARIAAAAATTAARIMPFTGMLRSAARAAQAALMGGGGAGAGGAADASTGGGGGPVTAALAFVDRIAAAVRTEDAAALASGQRFVTTAVADIMPDKAAQFNRLCHNIDVLGINVYNGSDTLHSRLQAQGYKGRYLVLETGTAGCWPGACSFTAWGAPVEETSTQKCARLVAAFQGAVVPGLVPAGSAGAAGGPQCLGVFAFLAGCKHEATHTWFSMFTPSGAPVADRWLTLSWLWRGVLPPPQYLPGHIAAAGLPTCISLTCTTPQASAAPTVKPGASVTVAALPAPGSAVPLTAAWYLDRESGPEDSRKDAPPMLPPLQPATPGAVSDAASGCSITFAAPTAPGAYRLYVYVRNASQMVGGVEPAVAALLAAGGVATATMPLLVQ